MHASAAVPLVVPRFARNFLHFPAHLFLTTQPVRALSTTLFRKSPARLMYSVCIILNELRGIKDKELCNTLSELLDFRRPEWGIPMPVLELYS